MSTLTTPFRYDFVGSFLRPEALKEARKSFAAGSIGADELKAVEDREILALIAKIKQAGYHVLTDGEFRRFMWGFDGIGHAPTKTGLPFAGEAAMIDDTFVTGRIAYKGTHPFLDHFRFVKAQEDESHIAKQTIPSPAQFLAQFSMPFARETTRKIYSYDQDDRQLTEDIVTAYKAFIQDLYAAGCRNLLTAPGACWSIRGATHSMTRTRTESRESAKPTSISTMQSLTAFPRISP